MARQHVSMPENLPCQHPCSTSMMHVVHRSWIKARTVLHNIRLKYMRTLYSYLCISKTHSMGISVTKAIHVT